MIGAAGDRERRKQAWQDAISPQFGCGTAARARKRMDRVDGLPADVRRVVHEFGLEVVWEFWTYRVERGHVMRVLIKAAQGAENPDCEKLANLFRAHGIRESRRINYLIATARSDPHPDGNTRFRPNSGKNAKPNLLNDEDDVAYYLVGGK